MTVRTGFFSLVVLLLATTDARAQVDGVLQIDDGLYRFLFRQQVAGRLSSAHLSHQPLSAADAQAYLDSLALVEEDLGSTDRALLRRYRRTDPGPGAQAINDRFARLYSNGHDLVGASGPDWSVSVNPIFVGAYGAGKRTAGDGVDDSPTVWHNTRGVRVAGTIGNHFFFEGRFSENQQRVVQAYSRDGSAPRRGFANLDDGVYDWMDAVGVVGVRSKYLEARFGRDRYRWGYGLSSPYLSKLRAGVRPSDGQSPPLAL